MCGPCGSVSDSVTAACNACVNDQSPSLSLNLKACLAIGHLGLVDGVVALGFGLALKAKVRLHLALFLLPGLRFRHYQSL